MGEGRTPCALARGVSERQISIREIAENVDVYQPKRGVLFVVFIKEMVDDLEVASMGLAQAGEVQKSIT
jgi:hypothetical protein